MSNATSSQHLILNTRNTCFICLHSLTPPTTPRDPETSEFLKHLPIKLLCKYLKVNPQYFCNEDNQQFPDDFRVTLCTLCTSLVQTVEDLVKQQEIVARLLEHHVKLLNQVLVDSKRTPGLWTTLNIKLQGNTTLIKKLRVETKRKCKRKVVELTKQSFPKVVVPRAEFPRNASKDDQNLKPEKTKGTVSKTNFTCKWADGGCGQIFHHKFQLNRHKELATKRGKKWLCKTPETGCGSQFASWCALNRHQKVNEHRTHLKNGNLKAKATPKKIFPKKKPASPLTTNSNDSNGRNKAKTARVSLRGADRPRDELGKLIWNDDFGEVTCWCKEPYGGRSMIQCDKCLVWNHMDCEDLTETSIPLKYFCGGCA